MADNGDDDLWESADSWKAAAIAFAIGTPCVCGFFFPWIYAATTDGRMLQRVQIVGGLAAFGIAMVTFSTVVWRGLISTQQAKLQRIQIDKLSAQIAATDVSNLASLLQKGAELIAEIDKPARVAAGIASLRAVGEGSDDQFGVQAMDILADYVQQRQAGVFSDQVGMSAINALELIHRKTKRFANRNLVFDFDTELYDPEDDVRFELITGVFKVTYTGGYFEGIELTPSSVGSTTFRFHDVRILEGHVDFRCAEMTKCFIKGAAIVRFDSRRMLNNQLVGCDFSGCQIDSANLFPDLRENRNWFSKDRPPQSDIKDMDWSTKLFAGWPVEDVEELEDDDSIFSSSTS